MAHHPPGRKATDIRVFGTYGDRFPDSLVLLRPEGSKGTGLVTVRTGNVNGAQSVVYMAADEALELGGALLAAYSAATGKGCRK